MRRGILSEEAITANIREIRDYLGTAVDRNFEKWGYSFLPENDLLSDDYRKIGSYEEAMEQYETRLISICGGWMSI